MINWLNTNQGFVMAMLTTIYVIATFAIVHMNRQTIREMQVNRENEIRPYLLATLVKDPRDMCFFLKIQNYGKTGCKVEDISITPALKFVDNADINNLLPGAIFAPNQLLNFIIVEECKETRKINYEIMIKYSPLNEDSTSYNEKYTIVTQYTSLFGHTETSNSGLSHEANQMKRIADYLDAIRNKLL